MAVALASCASPPAGFDSPEPAARLAAITKAAETRDAAAIPRLIESLQNDDPVVRLAAIRALELLTGQTLGYDYADPEWKRKEAIKAWVEWYQANGIAPTGQRAGDFRTPARTHGAARSPVPALDPPALRCCGPGGSRPIRAAWG